MSTVIKENCRLLAEEESPRLHGKTEEERYEHMGFGHLEALASSSSSLGLISTLVFSLCIGNLSETQSTSDAPIKTVFSCLATVFSCYTTCFSLLEYYYIQTFVGVDHYMAGRVAVRGKDVAKLASETEDEGAALASRVKLVTDVRGVFGSLNSMRAIARNSMWLGLLSLVFSAATQIDIIKQIGAKWSPAMTMLCFFGCCFCFVGPAWYFVGGLDFGFYVCACAAGVGMMLADIFFFGSEYPWADIVALLILCSAVIVVPYTVLSFRKPLMPIVKKYIHVY